MERSDLADGVQVGRLGKLPILRDDYDARDRTVPYPSDLARDLLRNLSGRGLQDPAMKI